jgi:hypothetical protein
MREMMQPRKIDKAAFLLLLADLSAMIEADDSMEGNLTYEWSDEPGFYLVSGVMRTGNSMGQGGMRVIGDMG